MAASVLACLIFIFLLPCFSNSCTPTLPCDHSIRILSPFVFQSDITDDPNCHGYLSIGCDNDNNMPFLLWYSGELLSLESISYNSNIITVQDPYLRSFLDESDCGNLYFNFSTPVNNFDNTMYCSFTTSFFSVRCHLPDQMQSPPKTFGKDYNLSYSQSPDEDEPSNNCSRRNNYDSTFELNLLFKNGSRELSLLSASYSSDLLARPGCFANWIEVFDCEGCKG